MNSFTIKNCPDCEQNRQKQIVMERELAETRGSNYEHSFHYLQKYRILNSEPFYFRTSQSTSRISTTIYGK